jgi:hypothetical protein
MDYKSDSTQNYGLYNILLRETLHRIMDYTSFCQEMFYTRLWIIQHFVKKDFYTGLWIIHHFVKRDFTRNYG